MHPSLRRLLTSKYFLFPSGALLLYTLIGFFLLPLAITWYVPKAALDRFNCRASLDKIRINPFRMNVEATRFTLVGPDGAPLAGFEKLILDLAPSGIFRRTAKFSEFHLDKPNLHLVFEADGETNFAKLSPKSAKAEPPTPSSSRSIQILLQTVAIAGGELTVTDKRQSVPETLTLGDLNLTLKDLSTIRDQIGSYSLSTTTQEEETLQWQGEIGLEPFRSSGRLAFTKIQTATLWGFVRDSLGIEAPAGAINISTDYRIDASGTPLQLALENFTVSLSDTSLKLTKTDRPFFELSTIDVDSVRLDLVKKSIQVGKILVDGGMLRFLVGESGTSNLEKIRRKPPAQEQKVVIAKGPAIETPPPTAPDSAPWTVDLEAIEIKSIGFDLEDRSRVLPLTAGVSSISISARAKIEAGAKSTKILFQQLAAEIKKLRVGIKGAPDPLFAANRFFVEGGEVDLGTRNLTLERVGLSDGRLGISRDESGKINLEQLFTAKNAAPSSPTAAAPPWKINLPAVELKDIAFDFNDSSASTPVNYGISSISASSSVAISTGPKIDGTVKGIAAELKELRLGNKGAKAPAFEVHRFFVQGGEADLGKRTIVIPTVGLSDGSLDVVREQDGELNLKKIFASKTVAAQGDSTGKKTAANNEHPWTYSVKSFELSKFRSQLSDRIANPKTPLYQLKDLRIRATDIDGHSPMGVDLSFGASPKGSVSLQGTVNPTTRSVDGKIKVTNLPLTPLQPYLEPFITLTLQSASMSTEGTFRYGAPKTGSKIAYNGNFNLDKLRLTEPGSKETFLGWTALQIPQIRVNVEPNNLQIKEIKLKKLQGQLIIAEDKTVNFAKIVKEQSAEDSAPQPSPKRSRPTPAPHKGSATPPGEKSGDSFPFTIGKVVVEDGDIVFADLSMEPKFMTRIHSLKGMISQLSSSGDSLSQIQLDGGVDQYGYAKVTGKLDLHDIKRSAEINMVFQNVALTSVTPYSGKFAGRSIKSGKLFMDLGYTIKDNQMLGDNKIIVENLELGEHVDSPEAINLPLDLAVALLKDTSGKIDIGLPVKGDLNDPQFSIGPLIWKAFANLITKAVTAPFRALGSLFGGTKEKFDVVAFAPGRAELLPPEKEKLKKLADVLLKRPQLRLIVQGQYSPEADGLVFKQHSVQRSVATIAQGKLPTDEDPAPLDLEDSKTRRALEKIFEERFGAPALSELDRGVKEGTIKARPVEALPPAKDTTGRQNRFMKIVQGAKLYKLIPGAKSPEQSALLAAEIYARLIESEPVAAEALLELGRKRAQSVAAELETAGDIPPTRITTTDPESGANEEGRSVKLSLAAL